MRVLKNFKFRDITVIKHFLKQEKERTTNETKKEMLACSTSKVHNSAEFIDKTSQKWQNLSKETRRGVFLLD